MNDDEKSFETWYQYEETKSVDVNFTSTTNLTVINYSSGKYFIPECVLYVLIVSIIVCSLLIILLLLYIFKKNRSLINNSVNIFILNIVLTDALKCFVQLPIYALSIHVTFAQSTHNYPEAQADYFLSNVVCNLNLIVMLISEIVQLLSFLGISYERYKIVISPFLNSNKRLRLSRILLLFAWIISIVLTSVFFLIITLVAERENFSASSYGCYLDVYNSLIGVVTADEGQIHFDADDFYLRDLENNIVDYFHLTFSLSSFLLTGYFYVRIILFLNFHEKNVFKFKTKAVPNNKVEPCPTNDSINTVQKAPLDEVVMLPKKSNKMRFMIVDENGNAQEPTEQKPADEQLTVETTVNNNTTQEEVVDFVTMKKPATSDATIVIHGEDGTVVQKKQHDLKNESLTIEGDVCVMNNKNKEKGKRRLEVRTAKKTFILMLSFVSCRFSFLLTVIIRKIPITVRDSYEANGKLDMLNQLEICFHVVSFLSCFFNSFTFIMVTDFFRNEALRHFRNARAILKAKLNAKRLFFFKK